MKTLKRRRKENKTDYLIRVKLLKSNCPRIVFRKTNKYVIGQYIESKEARDKIVLGVTSKELLKFGWPKEKGASLKSLPASYLLGFLLGNKIKEKKLEIPIVDLGMLRTNHKTNPQGFIKGLIDAGLEIKAKKEAFPSEDRIKGDHLKNKIAFEKIKSEISKK